MDKKIDPNQIFKKEQIFEEVIQRMFTKDDWSTEKKMIHLRRLDIRLNANKQSIPNEDDPKEELNSFAR